MHHQFFNNESIELSSSSEIGNIIQEGEVIFKKNPTVGLAEVSRLINSAMSKRQEGSEAIVSSISQNIFSYL